MSEMNGDDAYSRRNVLRSAAKAGIGAGALVATGAGAVQANPDCAVADGDDGDVTVYAGCGTDPFYEVPNGETGEVPYWCEDENGETVLHVHWDSDEWPDGQVYADEISSC